MDTKKQSITTSDDKRNSGTVNYSGSDTSHGAKVVAATPMRQAPSAKLETPQQMSFVERSWLSVVISYLRASDRHGNADTNHHRYEVFFASA